MTLAAQVLALVAVLVSSCGSPSTPAAPASGSAPGVRLRAEESASLGLSIKSGTVGPFLSRGPNSSLLLWARPAEPDAGWWSTVLDDSGNSVGPPRRIAPSPGHVELVRFSSTETSAGLIVFTGSDDQGNALWAMAVGEQGRLGGGPHRIATLPNGAVWLDSVQMREGYLAFWAERGTSHAQIMAVVLDASGHPQAELTRVHEGATSWQVQGVTGGAVLAVVNASGEVEVLGVDARAKVHWTHPIENSAGAGSDLDLARSGSELLLAFSRAVPLQRHLLQVRISTNGKLLTEPDFLVAPKGEQQLFRLVSGDPAYAVWTEPDFSDDILTAPVATDGSIDGEPIRLAASGQTPEFAVTPTGLQVLYWSCAEKAGCEEPLLPTLLQSDKKGRIVKLSSWRNNARGVPDLAWDLRCEGNDCKALSATFSSPARVEVHGHNDGQWALPKAIDAPGPKTSRAVVATEKLAGLQVATLGDGQLVTWLTDFAPDTPYTRRKTPAPDGRLAPVRAKLMTLRLSDDNSADAEPQIISYRARSIAGLSLTQRGTDALLAWTAIDNNEPQIFTTLLNKHGIKVRQRMLTRQQGEPSELSSAPLTDGWVVSWCNTTKTKTHAYMAKIGPNLNRISQDTNLGESRDLRAVEAWGQVWTLRNAPGGAILLGARHLKSFKPTREETPLSENGTHPRLVRNGGQVLAAWVGAGEKPRLHWVPISAQGAPDGEAKSAVLRGPPAELNLRCTEGPCQASLSSTAGRLEHLVLDGSHTPSLVALTDASLPFLMADRVWFHQKLGDGQFAIVQASP